MCALKNTFFSFRILCFIIFSLSSRFFSFQSIHTSEFPNFSTLNFPTLHLIFFAITSYPFEFCASLDILSARVFILNWQLFTLFVLLSFCIFQHSFFFASVHFLCVVTSLFSCSYFKFTSQFIPSLLLKSYSTTMFFRLLLI